MRHVIIGDIHAKSNWRAVVDKHKLEQCKFVFLGDYFDSFDGESSEVQIDNFNAICEMQENNTERCVMLLGNHDFHYLPGVMERYSGYQKKPAGHYGALIELALAAGTVQVAYSHENVLFTHAGVTNTWIDQTNIKERTNAFIVARHINQLFNNNKSAFCSSPKDTSMRGESVHQGPLWVRPSELVTDGLTSIRQCVGHTMRVDVATDVGFGDTTYPQFMFNDCLHKGKYCIIEDGGAFIPMSL